VRQPHRAGTFDQPQDSEAAERAALHFREEIRIYRRQAIAEPVGQAGANEAVVGVAELDHEGFDRGVFDHGAIVVKAHRRHVAVTVAGELIALEQLILLGGGAGRNVRAFHAQVGLEHPAQ